MKNKFVTSVISVIIVISVMFVNINIIESADQKVSDLTADSTPGTDSLLYTVDDPSGTSVSRKSTIGELFSAATDLDANGTISANAVGTSEIDLSISPVWTGEHDYSAGGIEIENNDTLPGSCTTGQVFLDTNATSGQQLFGCESGSFVLQGDGKAAGSSQNLWETFTSSPFKGSTIADSATDTFTFAEASGVTVGIVGDTITFGLENIDNLDKNITSGGIVRLDIDGTGINAVGSINFGATATDSGIYWNGTNLEIDTTSAIELSISGTPEADLAADGFNIITGDSYQINNTSVLNATTLGSGVTASSLTSVGTIATGTWEGTTVAVAQGGTGATTLNNLITLTTHTTGNYADGDGEAGAALTGDSATSFFSSGTIEHERGGLEADVSAFGGVVGINGGSTIDINLSSEMATAITDETGTGVMCFATAPTFTTSITVTGGATIDADGVDAVSGNDYEIDGTSVLTATTLGSAVVNSSLTSVGTIATGTWEGTTVAVDQGGTGATSLADGGILLGSGTSPITALGVATNGQIPIGDGATDPVLATITGGAGATITNGAGSITVDNNFHWVIRPQQMKLPGTNPMGIDAGNVRWRGLFDAGTAEAASAETVLRPFSGNLTLKAKVFYTMVSATSGTAAIDIQIDCVTDADARDVDSDTNYGTVDTLTGTVNGTAGRLDVLSDASLNEDSCAEDDHITVAINRNVATDSASGDLELRKVIIYAE